MRTWKSSGLWNTKVRILVIAALPPSCGAVASPAAATLAASGNDADLFVGSAASAAELAALALFGCGWLLSALSASAAIGALPPWLPGGGGALDLAVASPWRCA